MEVSIPKDTTYHMV